MGIFGSEKTLIFLKIGNFKNFATLAIPKFKQTSVPRCLPFGENFRLKILFLKFSVKISDVLETFFDQPLWTSTRRFWNVLNSLFKSKSSWKLVQLSMKKSKLVSWMSERSWKSSAINPAKFIMKTWKLPLPPLTREFKLDGNLYLLCNPKTNCTVLGWRMLTC